MVLLKKASVGGVATFWCCKSSINTTRATHSACVRMEKCKYYHYVQILDVNTISWLTLSSIELIRQRTSHLFLVTTKHQATGVWQEAERKTEEILSVGLTINNTTQKSFSKVKMSFLIWKIKGPKIITAPLAEVIRAALKAINTTRKLKTL